MFKHFLCCLQGRKCLTLCCGKFFFFFGFVFRTCTSHIWLCLSVFPTWAAAFIMTHIKGHSVIFLHIMATVYLTSAHRCQPYFVVKASISEAPWTTLCALCTGVCSPKIWVNINAAFETWRELQTKYNIYNNNIIIIYIIFLYWYRVEITFLGRYLTCDVAKVSHRS